MRWLAFLPMALCAMPALAMEETVTFEVHGMRVVGTLTLPEGVTNPPAVLMLHGFSGRRDEIPVPALGEGAFARAARVWAEDGIASLRIDYRFNGDSDGDFADSTMTAHLEDSLAAMDWLATSGRVDPTRLGVMGISMGGILATGVGARSAHPIRAMALWSPGTNFAASFTLLVGHETMRAGLAAPDGESIAIALPWGDQIALRRPFFESLFLVDPLAEITRYDGPLLVAVGQNDDLVFPQPLLGQAILDYHGDERQQLIVRPVDHIFNVFLDPAPIEELIGLTGAFLAENFAE